MTTCPKCGYVRQTTDTAPDYECPGCGIVYAKYIAAQEAAEAKKLEAAKADPVAPVAPPVVQVVGISPRETICTACGSLGSSRQHTKGSLGIEIVLWLFFLVPGLIYSFWRHSSRGTVCAQCGSPSLIAVGTPVGRKLLDDWHEGVVVDASAKVGRPARSFGDAFISMFFLAFALLLVATFVFTVLPAALR